MNIVEFAFGVALCALPTAFCVLIWRRSPLVRSVGRVLVAIGCISLVGCSDAQWKDWGDRQYRLQRVDNIVHVEIREGGMVEDVDTHASTFSRYDIKTVSADELLLKSSDIGSWLIGKQGGRWRVYVRENGEIRCVDNEILPDETKGAQR